MHPDNRRTPSSKNKTSDVTQKQSTGHPVNTYEKNMTIEASEFPTAKRAPSRKSGGVYIDSKKPTIILKKCHGPVILTIVVMILFILAQIFLKTPALNKQNPYIAIVIVQFLVFILPAAFMSAFSNHRMDSGLSYYNFRLFSPRMLGFVFSALAVMLLGNMIIKYLGYLMFGIVNSSTVIYENDNIFALIAATVLVPAITEEILFRGVIFTEYEKRGVGALGAILGSSVLFAFIHFDSGNFISYLFAGIILAMVIHVTRSLLAPIIIHLLNNTICLFTDTFIRRVSKESISTFFVIFLLTVIFLIALFILIENLEWICNNKADKKSVNKALDVEANSFRLIPRRLKVKTILSSIFVTPLFLIVIILYFINILAFN